MAVPPKSSDPYLGTLINERFRVERLIARGAMGRVYQAEQLPLGRIVAVKVLDPQVQSAADPHFERRFFLEASVASKLRHPNTVTVFDYGRTEEGTYFIAMEFVDGESLLSVLHRERRLAPVRVATIAIQIARSLREAHRLDVVHRDLKPANVLLTRHGDDSDFVKVLDFGLVKAVEDGTSRKEEATQTGVFMGSPKYMAPEQIRGGPCDARTDVYALGVVMYHLLAGAPPFDSDTAVKTLMAHMHDPVPPLDIPGVPDSFKALVYKCLAKDPDFRSPSMDQVIDRLKQLGPTMGKHLRHDRSAPPLSASSVSASEGECARPAQATPKPATRSSASSAPSRHVRRVLSGLFKVLVVAGATVLAGLWALSADQGPGDERRPWVEPWSDAPSPENAPPATAAPPAPPTSEAPHGEGTPKAALELAATPVSVSLTSTPSGAEAWVDGQPVGTTPLRWTLSGEGPQVGRELRIVLRKPGFQPLEVLRRVQGPRLVVHATLVRAPP